ncbi:hypothetical protein PGT21_005313 [Puccinia graminis f. sp. tritici]|uniref:Uncharacterized protein n=1 Tax=Puccinia graminis f. sp. tritici TaxID=56615 RepID=A0A5B0NBJ2_PUCGR|nr:hypothetical protein PGT21_005313 [Puccinia graminis f. sp. tritici]
MLFPKILVVIQLLHYQSISAHPLLLSNNLVKRSLAMDTKEITYPEQELANGKKDYDKLSLVDVNFGTDEANVFPPAQCSTAPQVNTLESFEHSDFMRDSNSLKETIGDSKGGLSSTLPPQAIQYLFEQLIKSPSGIPGNFKYYENPGYFGSRLDYSLKQFQDD